MTSTKYFQFKWGLPNVFQWKITKASLNLFSEFTKMLIDWAMLDNFFCFGLKPFVSFNLWKYCINWSSEWNSLNGFYHLFAIGFICANVLSLYIIISASLSPSNRSFTQIAFIKLSTFSCIIHCKFSMFITYHFRFRTFHSDRLIGECLVLLSVFNFSQFEHLLLSQRTIFISIPNLLTVVTGPSIHVKIKHFHCWSVVTFVN